MCLVAPTTHLYGGAGTPVGNKAKGLPPIPWQKAVHFQSDGTVLSSNGKIIPRILFSAKQNCTRKMRYLFGFYEENNGRAAATKRPSAFGPPQSSEDGA
jgi:hypothetical protein